MRRVAWSLLAVALVAWPFAVGEFYVNLASQIFIAAVFAAKIGRAHV